MISKMLSYRSRNKSHANATGIIFGHSYRAHRASNRELRAVTIVALPRAVVIIAIIVVIAIMTVYAIELVH